MSELNNKTRLQVAKMRLELYLKAERAILSGQSYEAEGLKLTRANLADVQSMIADLEALIGRLEAGSYKRRRVIVPKDGW